MTKVTDEIIETKIDKDILGSLKGTDLFGGHRYRVGAKRGIKKKCRYLFNQ